MSTFLIKSDSVTGTQEQPCHVFFLILIMSPPPKHCRDSAPHCTGVLSGREGPGPGRARLCSPPPRLLVPHLQVSTTPGFLSEGLLKMGAPGSKGRVSTGGVQKERQREREVCCVYQCDSQGGKNITQSQNLQMKVWSLACVSLRWYF